MKVVCYKTAVEQFNGREGETATLLSRCLVSLNLRGGGFAPRHLSRSPPVDGKEISICLT